MASYDADRTERALDWPLADLLAAYLAAMREQASERHFRDTMLWALLAPHVKKPGDPPAVPDLLR